MKLIITLLSFALFLHTAHSETLNFSSFNIRWYGLGGDPNGTLKDEKRDSTLSEFMNNITEISKSDVIAFQEIVNPDGLKALLPQHTCTSYDHESPKHQHVMICVKKPYKLIKERSDSNFIFEDISSPIKNGKLRPAVHGVLIDKNKRPIAHLIAVHLKAEPPETATRLIQANLLKKHVDEFKDQLPVIMLGDFNTHLQKDTGLKKDDYVAMDEIFSAGKNTLKHIPNTQLTFRDPKHYFQLDHVWTSAGIKTSDLIVYPICQKEASGEGFMNPDFYFKEISDHCPISFSAEIK